MILLCRWNPQPKWQKHLPPRPPRRRRLKPRSRPQYRRRPGPPLRCSPAATGLPGAWLRFRLVGPPTGPPARSTSTSCASASRSFPFATASRPSTAPSSSPRRRPDGAILSPVCCWWRAKLLASTRWPCSSSMRSSTTRSMAARCWSLTARCATARWYSTRSSTAGDCGSALLAFCATAIW